ncbi:MAG: M23 family metallopeptidase [Selenomonadaceae bacterium]|nr:M23 family metallopeptidase [Selenomonadaceae bacterium]
MCNVKNFLAAMLLVFAVTIFGTAEAAIVADKMPLQCYVDHKVTSYDVNSGQAVGWIDAEVDLVKITEIYSNGVARGTHPGRNGTVERLFWARDVFADTNYNNRPAHIDHYQQVYRTPNSNATIGSVNNEDVTVVADNGNRAQIIYRLDNGTGYKMGWVPSSVVADNSNKANFQLADYNLTSPSDHQLRFTGRLWNANNYSEITGVHVYIGGGVGAGGEFIGEFRADRDNHRFDHTMNVPQNRSGSQLVVIYAVNGIDAKELDRRNINVFGSSSSFDPIWPLANSHTISVLYNYSVDGTYKGARHFSRYLCGIDMAAPEGEDVLATESGTVIASYYSTSSGFGNMIKIKHDNGKVSLYAHMSARLVESGQRVSKGQVIGKVGHTSAKYKIGNHLHFELGNSDDSGAAGDPWKEYFKPKYGNIFKFIEAAAKDPNR